MKMLLHVARSRMIYVRQSTYRICYYILYGLHHCIWLFMLDIYLFFGFFPIFVSFSMFKVKCDRSANVTVCPVRVRWKRVGCDCRISVWSATIWKIDSMVHRVWWWATVCTAAVRILFNITTATVFNRTILHRVRTVYRPILFVAEPSIVEKIIGK